MDLIFLCFVFFWVFILCFLCVRFMIEKKNDVTPTNINELTDDLTILGELKEKGLLTEKEFDEQKKKLLKNYDEKTTNLKNRE